VAYQNEPFSSPWTPPVAREFHSALFPRLVFRVGGNSTLITDQETSGLFQILFRRPICMSLSQHCSVLARCSPLACLYSCSTRLVTPHSGVSVALCALVAKISPYALSVLSFKSYLLGWWLYGNGRRRTSTHLLINPTSSAGIGSFTVDGLLHCYHI
jgi:hypothetical protein